MLSEHYDPAPSSIVQRFKFCNRVKTQGETIANYVAALRQFTKYCEYGDTLNMMLRDQLIYGVKEEVAGREKKERLLAGKN